MMLSRSFLKRATWVLLLFSFAALALVLHADGPVGPRETPPSFAAFPDQETLRIRIVNAVDGAIQVSNDAGQTWQIVGRVTAPATQSLMGYLASGYAPISTVAATAVHGIRIRVGDLTSAYPLMINILPREFSQTPVRFGGHVSGASGIYTNISSGTAIFRDLSPYPGNPVFLQNTTGTLTSLPTNYTPHVEDMYVIIVRSPVNPLRQVVFDNVTGGAVTATYADGTSQVLTTVIKPVYGVGRFDGTSYTGVGAINTNHTGVITVSTAPVTHSTLLEGTGPERRGGFQIEPAYHNSETDEAGAPSILVVGSPLKKRTPDLEGTPPLFHGYFNLAWNADSPRYSWRVEIQRGSSDSPWLAMPALVGDQPAALMGVTAIRIVQEDAGDQVWREKRVAAAAADYESQEMDEARAGKLAVVRGSKTINISASDPRTKFMAFFVDGTFKALSNAQPFSFTWDTSDSPDGEYVLEARAEDEEAQPLQSSRTRVWVDNANKLLR